MVGCEGLYGDSMTISATTPMMVWLFPPNWITSPMGLLRLVSLPAVSLRMTAPESVGNSLEKFRPSVICQQTLPPKSWVTSPRPFNTDGLRFLRGRYQPLEAVAPSGAV